MIGTDVAVGGMVLLLTVPAGLIAHEWAHAIVLRLAGIEYEVVYFPDRADGVLAALASCPWAAVHPRPNGHEPPWVLRVAALVPFALAAPVLVLSFIAGGTFPFEHPAFTAAAIGWLACAIPSPKDFSVAFYAHQVLEETRDASPSDTG